MAERVRSDDVPASEPCQHAAVLSGHVPGKDLVPGFRAPRRAGQYLQECVAIIHIDQVQWAARVRFIAGEWSCLSRRPRHSDCCVGKSTEMSVWGWRCAPIQPLLYGQAAALQWSQPRTVSGSLPPPSTTDCLYSAGRLQAAATHLALHGRLVHLVQVLQPALDLVRGLVDLVDVVLHLLAQLLHVLRPHHGLALLVLVLQQGLVPLDDRQQVLQTRGNCSSSHFCWMQAVCVPARGLSDTAKRTLVKETRLSSIP